MNPREDLTEPTPTAPGTLRLSMPVSSPGTEASEKVNPRLNIIIYVLKPVCVYSSLLLRCFIDDNISFGKHRNEFNTKKQEKVLDDCLRDINH